MLDQHLDTIYTYDSRGRITGNNQFSGGEVPRFHLARSGAANFWRLRHDVDDETAAALMRLAREEPLLLEPSAPPTHEPEYMTVLADAAPIEAVWRGPAYAFAQAPADPIEGVVHMHAGNAGLLRAYMDDWLEDVPHRRPFLAMVENGHAVAVCASVRITPTAHEAGVETAPGFRGRGHALRVVAAWAQAVATLGARPLYSTSWDNTASQAVAARLGLKFIGADFHVR